MKTQLKVALGSALDQISRLAVLIDQLPDDDGRGETSNQASAMDVGSTLGQIATAEVRDAERIRQVTTSNFKFGKSSLKELEGVKTELVLMTRRALELSSQDFCVFDGLRTVKEQQAYVAKGTSQTMQSKHLKGLAVDLVPWVGGKPVWDWNRIYPIALAVDQAATEMNIAHLIRWGGAWDRTLADFGGNAEAYFNECQAYQRRHEGKDFIDGPHFEWVG